MKQNLIMDKNQLDGLLALKLVAENKSFVSAASILQISPSAVSQIVKQLEERLGVALLQRTTRSMSLTEAGARFLSNAGPAIEQILISLNDIGVYAQKPSGLLRINTPKLIYSAYLAPIIKSFTEKYPEITAELFFEDAKSDIVEKGFDAGIRLADILMKDMVAIKLFGPVRFVTVASPEYLRKMGRPKHPKELLSHNCIRIRFGDYLYDQWEYQEKRTQFKVLVDGSLIFNDACLILQAAIDGSGLAYTMEDAVQDFVSNGQLEIVLSQYSVMSTGFYLYFPKRTQVQPKLRAFIEHIQSELRS